MGLRIVKDNSLDYAAHLRSLRALQIENELKRWAAVTDRDAPKSLINRVSDVMPEKSTIEELTQRLKICISNEKPRVEFIQGNLAFANISKLLED